MSHSGGESFDRLSAPRLIRIERTSTPHTRFIALNSGTIIGNGASESIAIDCACAFRNHKENAWPGIRSASQQKVVTEGERALFIGAIDAAIFSSAFICPGRAAAVSLSSAALTAAPRRARPKKSILKRQNALSQEQRLVNCCLRRTSARGADVSIELSDHLC